MDYQPLPLKYRPRTWTDLVGQTHAVEVLKRSITDGRIFHSYIFQGTAGSGKTSAARILAMALNCENLSDGSPCLECPSCGATLLMRNPDVVEIDGASHGQVEHVRDLKEQAMYQPFYVKRVFIIDEVHALSRSAFEALLKLLEEPPGHVVFILATTNPEKIPATIQSRSISLDFRRHDERDVVERLTYIAAEESIDLPEDSAELIARYADGSLRDSVTVLDQLATSHPDDPITTDLVATALGIVSGTELHSIMAAVLSHEAPILEAAVLRTLERTTEFGILTRAITDWYRDVLRVKAGAGQMVRRSVTDAQLLSDFASSLTYDNIESAIRISWELSDRVRFSSSNPKTFFLTGLYRLMLLAEAQPVEIPGPPPPVQELPQMEEPTVSAFSSPDTASVADLEAQLARLSG